MGISYEAYYNQELSIKDMTLVGECVILSKNEINTRLFGCLSHSTTFTIGRIVMILESLFDSFTI